MPVPGKERGQMLLAEEYFSTENAAFIETLRQVDQPKSLAALTDRWNKDPRPWARQQILDYVAQPFTCPGHQPVVKRLFKRAESAEDHERMAGFLVAFDRQVRRRLSTRYRWDSETRSGFEEEALVTPRDVLRPDSKTTGSRFFDRSKPRKLRGRLFSYRTRYYLRRRAWRYFRHLGFRDPAAYRTSIILALKAYEDADLAQGENILDSWGLMHICFAKSEVLEIGATDIRFKEAKSFADLSPAPAFPDTWIGPEAAPDLLSLIGNARSRMVRVWAMQLFRREHARFAASMDDILALLEQEEAEVQQLGSELLENSQALGTLPIVQWHRLLETRNEEALQRICDAFAKSVSPDRLTLSQCVALACARPTPIARLGQRYLQERPITTAEEREVICVLANADCAAAAGDLTRWALGKLGTPEHYQADQVICFFDGMRAGMREAAWEWMLANQHAQDDATLWSRLTETPYDDLRLRLIDYLQDCHQLTDEEAGGLQKVWRSVLLGVHRGGRQKVKAVRQIALAIVEKPDRGEALLPVLAVAVRSVRGPEARAGLSAVATVVEAQPHLIDAVKRLLPEITLLEATA